MGQQATYNSHQRINGIFLKKINTASAQGGKKKMILHGLGSIPEDLQIGAIIIGVTVPHSLPQKAHLFHLFSQTPTLLGSLWFDA